MRCRGADDHVSDKILFFLSANSIFSIFKKNICFAEKFKETSRKNVFFESFTAKIK